MGRVEHLQIAAEPENGNEASQLHEHVVFVVTTTGYLDLNREVDEWR